MSTYLALCQKFRKLVGISGTGPAAVTDQTGMNEKITLWVADADELIQRKWFDWDFLLKPKEVLTVPVGATVKTPAELSITDLARWVEDSFVRDPGTSSYQKLKFIEYDEFIQSEKYLGATQTGAIEYFSIRPNDEAVFFYPSPTAATTIWAQYYKTPTRLSANGSLSPIPDRFEDAILYRAKMFYAEYMEDLALRESANVDFQEIMTRLEADQLPGFKDLWVSSPDFDDEIMVE